MERPDHRRVGRRTGTLARRFDQVLEVLEHLGYVKDWALTDKGETLTRVYNESDLLVVESIERAVPMPVLALSLQMRFRSRQEDTFARMHVPYNSKKK